MKAIKNWLIGYLMGIVMTWLLCLISIPVVGTGNFTQDFYKVFILHFDEIFSYSLFVGSIMSLVWLFAYVISKRNREKRELEKAMTDYFKKKTEKEDSYQKWKD